MNVIKMSESCGALDLIQAGDSEAMKLGKNLIIDEMKKRGQKTSFLKKGIITLDLKVLVLHEDLACFRKLHDL